MEEEYVVTPKSPAGIALALGVIGLIMSIIGGVMFGIIGGGVGAVLGIIAIILGVQAKGKTDRAKGNGGFVTGIIALIFGLIMFLSFFAMGSVVKTTADEKGLPLLSKHGSAFTFGVVGLMASVSNEGDLDALKAELDSITNNGFNNN